MLKIWLPLNKDERNIGLMTYRNMSINNLSFVNDDTFGKVGYGLGLFHCDHEEFENTWTIAMWVKRDSWTTNGSNDILCCKNTSASTYCQWYFSQVGGKLNIGVNAGSSSYSVPFTFTNNVWIHVAAVYDGQNVYLYGNGELLGSKLLRSLMLTGCTNIGIACRSTKNDGSGYTGGNSYLSDFRVYSHALKDWEIKKIYNSCFYEMESNMHLESTNNLIAGLNYSVGNLELICSSTDDSDGGKYVTTGGQNGSFTGHTIRLNLPSDIPLTDGLPYTFSYRYKKVQGNGDMQSGIEINDGIPVIKAYPLYDTTKVEVIALSGSNRYSYASYRFLDYNNVAANSKYKMYDFQVEQKDHATPYTPSNRDERFVDMSGLDNEVVPYNITQSGSSLYFNGTDSAIKVPITKIITGGTWSINLWFYRPNGQFGSKAWETLIGGQSGFEFSSKRSSSSSPMLVAYSWGQSSSGGKDYEYDKWNMVTMVRTPSQFKAYLNGENFLTTTSVGAVPNGDYFIGAWQVYNKQNFKGYMRRFSIYAKAMSDDDVMNLYIHNE